MHDTQGCIKVLNTFTMAAKENLRTMSIIPPVLFRPGVLRVQKQRLNEKWEIEEVFLQ